MNARLPPALAAGWTIPSLFIDGCPIVVVQIEEVPRHFPGMQRPARSFLPGATTYLHRNARGRTAKVHCSGRHLFDAPSAEPHLGKYHGACSRPACVSQLPHLPSGIEISTVP